MEDQFVKYLNSHCGFKSGEKVLVALSGGADSIALLHLFKVNGIEIFAAHCNFNLRGDESDGDEDYVRDFCKSWDIELFVKSFDTVGYSSEKGISIEMAARDLRYAWFDDLLEQHEIDWVATGHHKDDSIETFFLNLLRGTGVRGLSGIKPLTGKVIRPLLGFSRDMIEDYCQLNHLNYRTDSSNLESVYTRNKIRNEIIPLFEQINPSFKETMLMNMAHVGQVNEFLSNTVEDIKQNLVVEQDDSLLISLRHVNEFKDKKLVLFEILHPYGFNSSTVSEVVEAVEQDVSGKQFFANEYRLIKDRHNLILLPVKDEEEEKCFYISREEAEVTAPVALVIEKNLEKDNYVIEKSRFVGQFDEELIEYPLTIRKWEQGDTFRPLGMKNFKKLSDFFIDQKFSLKDKEDVWLLLSGNDIIWIMGHRTDDRYKITEKTKRVIKFTLRSKAVPW